MALTDQYNVLGKTLSRAYVLKLLQEGYLVKDIARQWAKENKVDIFGGTREKIPAARRTLNTSISRFIFVVVPETILKKQLEKFRHIQEDPLIKN